MQSCLKVALSPNEIIWRIYGYISPNIKITIAAGVYTRAVHVPRQCDKKDCLAIYEHITEPPLESFDAENEHQVSNPKR